MDVYHINSRWQRFAYIICFIFYHTKAGLSILNLTQLGYTHTSLIFCICALLYTETLRIEHPISFLCFKLYLAYFAPILRLRVLHVFSEQTAIMSLNSMFTSVSIMEVQAVIWEEGPELLNLIESILVLLDWIALSPKRGNSLWKLSSFHLSPSTHSTVLVLKPNIFNLFLYAAHASTFKICLFYPQSKFMGFECFLE